MAISNDIWALLSAPTVLSEMEKDPKASPVKVGEQLFGKKAVKKLDKEEAGTNNQATSGLLEGEITQEDLDRAASTGNFPSRPSDLFLKVRSAAVLNDEPF